MRAGSASDRPPVPPHARDAGPGRAALSAAGALEEAHDGRFARATVVTCFVAVFAGIVWASRAPLDVVTTGEGLIRTEAPVERIEHLDGGRVARIAARAGDLLAPGDPILVLETAPIERALITVGTQIATLAAEADRVAHVLARPEGDPPPRPDGGSGSGAEEAFWAEQAYLAAQLDLLATDSANIERRMGVLDRQRDTLAEERVLLEGRLARLRALRESGSARAIDVEALEREILQLERGDLSLAGEHAAAADALNGNRLRRLELLAGRRRDAALRREEIGDRLVALRQEAAALRERLSRTEVRTLAGGTVLAVQVSGPGEVVGAGDLIAEIVPAAAAVRAEIEIGADRIGTIAPGMAARLKIMSYDFTRFGVVDGRIASISPTSYVNPEGQDVFRVIVDLSGTDAAPTLGGQPIRAGMTVIADILSGQNTVLAYLLKPLRAIRDRAMTES